MAKFMINKIPIGIKSCQSNKNRQEAIRNTWLKNIDTNKFFPIFLIGNKERINELADGVLYLEADDSYQGLTGKLKKYYEWCLNNTNSSHFWTCDDDSYINCSIFNTYNEYINYDYCGNFIYGIDKIENKLSGYVGGCGVVVSRIAANICSMKLPDTSIDQYDDVIIGDVLNKYVKNLKKLHIPNIHPWSYCQYIPNLMIGHYIHKGRGSLDTFESSILKMHNLYHITSKKKLVFDIGSNIGNSIEYFLNFYDQIIGFEPNPAVFDLLSKRFKQYKNRVILDSRAISNSIGKQLLMVSSMDTISTLSHDWVYNSRFTKDYTWEQTLEVETTTIDQIVDEYGVPDLIKIDVEGHEFEVFLGLSKKLPNTIICFEWTEENYSKLNKIADILQNLGYCKFDFVYQDIHKLDSEITWRSWADLDLHKNIVPERQEYWGIIYTKI